MFTYVFPAKKRFINCLQLCFSNMFSDKTKKTLSRWLLFLLPAFSISAFAGDLFVAVQQRNLIAINQLINEGADVNIQNEHGNTPLHEAIYNGFTKGAILLIVPDFKIFIADNNGWNVVHAAILKKNTVILEYLIPFISHINAVDKWGNTALHIAAREGCTSCIELLLNSKKRSYAPVSQGYNPFSFALLTNENEDESVLTTAINVNCENIAGDTPSHLAARGGHYECLLKLLKTQGIDVNHKNKNKYTALDYAIKAGHTNCVELLSTFCSKLSGKPDKKNNNLIHKAVFENDLRSLRFLLEDNKFINVNIQDENGCSPLWHSAAEGKQACLDILLKVPDVEINSVNNSCISPIYAAVMNGHAGCVKELCAAGADIYINTNNFSTVLHRAAYTGDVNCVNALLEVLPVNCINIKDYNDDTPLHQAAYLGHTECVRSLLQFSSVDINAVNNYNKTPLHRAVDQNQWKCVQILRQFDADVNAKDVTSFTALHIAANKGFLDCIEELIKFDHIDVNAANDKKNTPLHQAAHQGHTECVKSLLQFPSVDINSVNSSNKTPLHRAVEQNQWKCVQILRQFGADVNIKDAVNFTALHIAANRGFPTCINELIQFDRIDVNAVNNDENTPLHMAALKGYTECIQALLQSSSININALNDHNKTALHSAVDRRYLQCVKILIAAGTNLSICSIYGTPALYVAAKKKDSECFAYMLAKLATP